MQPRQLTPPRQIPPALIAPLVFAGLTLAILHTALFQLGNAVISSSAGDLNIQFIPWREFGFGQLKHGNFPLWNPYIFGGTPYFAGFQSALLYPPNWLHLILSVPIAINWIIALHLFAAGYFTYLWCRGRYASIGGSILAGLMFMFSGPYFLHIYAGHLANLAVMIWAPLLFLAIDKLNETGSLQWCLLGVLAVTMQILGGHPQYLYYTGLMSFLYAAIVMIRSTHRISLAGGYVIIYTGACLVAAVQLLSGLQAAGESVRSQGTEFYFASMFALPPENLLTLLAPNVLGKLTTSPDPTAIVYFGRCYLWETSVFISITGLVLSMIGAIAGWRKNIPLISIIFVALILALGKHLPLYQLMYNYFPEYSHFRVVAKFIFLMCLFLCVLAATGFDLLLAQPKTLTAAAVTTGSIAIVLAFTALLIFSSTKEGVGGLWNGLVEIIQQSNESYLPQQHYQDTAFIRSSGVMASHAIGWAAATMGAVCALLCVTMRKPAAAYGLIFLAIIELCIFAIGALTIGSPDLGFPTQWLDPIRQQQKQEKDFRVVNAPLPGGGEVSYQDAGMALGIQNIWGYDPGVLKRYAEALWASQGNDPDRASQYLQIGKISVGFFQMLRCRFGLVWQGDTPTLLTLDSPLPVAQLVPNWVVQENRDKTLATINDANFDPRSLVVLETSPGIEQTEDGVSGPAEIVASSTDWVEIRTTTPTATMLLITNNYSTGWRVIPLESTSQTSYRIMPANHTLMAIPLQPGSHHFRIEYLPTAFRVGKWISIIALLGYAGAFSAWIIQRRGSRNPAAMAIEPATDGVI